jgi:serine/threonine protein kinase
MPAPATPENDPSGTTDLLDRFEQAWQQAPPPLLEGYLPGVGHPGRRSALVDLVHIDLEYRWKAGVGLPVEDYLERFPELRQDPALVVDLAAWEYEIRRRTDPELGVAQYAERFPACSSELAARLAGVTTFLAPPNLPPDSEKAPLPRIPGYEVLQELGRGGMGVVYKARHLGLDRILAVKLIRADLSLHPQARKRFEAEARAVARLDHPAIVRVYTSGAHEGQPYFVMEYVAGGSLAQELARGPLPAPAAASLVARLADGVEHAHRAGVIHRDLKPANVLLAAASGGRQPEASGGRQPPVEDAPPDGARTGDSRPPLASLTPRITDFGLARQMRPDAPSTPGGCLGTPAYMAPEQADGRVDLVGPATDVFGLGAILYECLTGGPPHRAAGRDDVLSLARKGEIVPPRQVNPRIPAAVERICLRALAAEPARRHPSAAALACDLRRWLLWRRLRWAFAAGLAGVLLVGLLVWWVLPGRPVEEKKPLRVESFSVLGSYNTRRDWADLLTEDRSRALPLPNGEMIHVALKLNQPAHVYVVYLDSEGDATPLYPWNETEITVESLDATPADDKPVLTVANPPWPHGWALQGKKSLDTVLVLADRAPLGPGRKLGGMIRNRTPAPFSNDGEVVVRAFDEGQPITQESQDVKRGPAKLARKIDNELLALLTPLSQAFEIVRAVRFSHKGD